MDIFNFGRIADTAEFEEWLTTIGLLPRRRKCDQCGEVMRRVISKKLFICSRKSVHQENKLVRISVNKGTLFEGEVFFFNFNSLI